MKLKLYKLLEKYYIIQLLYQQNYLNTLEMQDDISIKLKENRCSELNILNQCFKNKEPLISITDLQNETTSKSGTKLPPLRPTKIDQLSQSKTNETFGILNLQRKITEPDRKNMNMTQTQSISMNQAPKKFILKRKTQKKKVTTQSFKPQVLLRNIQYMNFLSYINISNNMKIICDQLEHPYTIYVGKGNNGSLIKNIFRTYRPWWTIQQSDPQSTNINLHWYQLRQNQILQQFKQSSNNQLGAQLLDYYVQEYEQNKVQNHSRSQSRSNQRSQSLIGKQISSFRRRFDPQMNKRASSKSKISNKSTEKPNKPSPSLKNHNIKQFKQEVMQSENQMHKKCLTNPKMWPIYFNYRKIFSASDMKSIKKLDIIQEDGKMYGKILRHKTRTIQNRSLNIKMHNHLTNNWNLSNKKALFMNIRHYFQAQKINPFDYIPMTFHIQTIGDKQYDCFVQQYHRRCQQIAQDQKINKKSQYKNSFKSKKRNAWLVKPGENTNRGNGIQVVESLQQIKQIITKDNTDSQGRTRTHIVQQYIMPFLYQKRKFDIRCYILITSINGIQKGYWYQDGYIRTACKQFNMKNLANRMIHLTNDAVQKKCQEYGKYQPGNKISFSDFQRYLDSNYNNIQNGQKLKFFQQAYPEMKKLATDAIKCVYTKINPTKKQFTFQIFGLDFMIDENFKVWLIEANTNPCLELSSPLLGRIIPSMLQNAFKIAVDPIFPPPPLAQIAKMIKKITMPQNSIQNNKFEIVFDEIQQGNQLKTILTNAPEVKIYNIEQEQEEYADSDKQDSINE